MAVSPDGSLLLSSDYRARELRLWDVEARKPIQTLDWGKENPTRGSFAPDGRHAAWCGANGGVRIYRLAKDTQDDVDVRKVNHSTSSEIPLTKPPVKRCGSSGANRRKVGNSARRAAQVAVHSLSNCRAFPRAAAGSRPVSPGHGITASPRSRSNKRRTR